MHTCTLIGKRDSRQNKLFNVKFNKDCRSILKDTAFDFPNKDKDSHEENLNRIQNNLAFYFY